MTAYNPQIIVIVMALLKCTSKSRVIECDFTKYIYKKEILSTLT